MSKTKTTIAIAGAVILSAAVAGGAVWWFMPQPAAAAGKDAKAHAQADKPKDGKPFKYVTLEKVIVMLRRGPSEADTHYLSADLVLATEAGKEKEAKEHLPLLRSLAVRTLSSYTMAEASGMTVEKYAAQLNRSFNADYERTHTEKPFEEVMIGKLIIE
jgi:flagellar FliL protein